MIQDDSVSPVLQCLPESLTAAYQLMNWNDSLRKQSKFVNISLSLGYLVLLFVV